MVDAGELTTMIDPRQFTLATAHGVHHTLAAGDNTGEVVIDIAVKGRGSAAVKHALR